jgi:hypothetical protein
MEGTYPILLGGEVQGQALVNRQGLYCCITCRCRLSGEVMYKVILRCGDHQEDLGILVPQNGGFCLQKRIPAKLLTGGELSFLAVPKHKPLAGKFVPLSPETPFPYLTKLENAYLARQNGQTGIVIQD